jgi:hypothetical protein
MTEQACGRLAISDDDGGVIGSRRKSSDDSSLHRQIAPRQADPRAEPDRGDVRRVLVS